MRHADEWTKQDIKLLRDGYAKGLTGKTIHASMDHRHTIGSLAFKARSLGIKKNKAAGKAKTHATTTAPKAAKAKVWTSVKPKAKAAKPAEISTKSAKFIPSQEVRQSVLQIYLSGVAPGEAKIILADLPQDYVEAEYERLGWSERAAINRLSPYSRIKIRRDLETRSASILNEPLDRNNSQHQMVLLVLAAAQARRDLAETARLSLLPARFIERIFGQLDVAQIWPVTDETAQCAKMDVSHYVIMADMCKKASDLLAEPAA